MSTETTPALEAAAAAMWDSHPYVAEGDVQRWAAEGRDLNEEVRDDERKHARIGLTAALTTPPDEDGMNELTRAIHAEICEDSPQECVQGRGRCVRAYEGVRVAVLGGGA